MAAAHPDHMLGAGCCVSGWPLLPGTPPAAPVCADELPATLHLWRPNLPTDVGRQLGTAGRRYFAPFTSRTFPGSDSLPPPVDDLHVEPSSCTSSSSFTAQRCRALQREYCCFVICNVNLNFQNQRWRNSSSVSFSLLYEKKKKKSCACVITLFNPP